MIQGVERLNHVIHPMLNYLNTEKNYDFKPYDIEKIINEIIICLKQIAVQSKLRLEPNKLSTKMIIGDSKWSGVDQFNHKLN